MTSPGEINLMNAEPGSDVGGGPPPARPQPADPPGDRTGGCLKVGDQEPGGGEFDYANGYFGADGPAPWKQKRHGRPACPLQDRADTAVAGIREHSVGPVAGDNH